ncbi:MAG: sugar phosphate nucleotidyltransferase [bacterium]
MYAVIMAGGQGARLWPLSRQKKPKQLHSFAGDKPLVRETYERLTKKFADKDIIVSTTPEFVDEIKKMLPEICDENYIVEPKPMNTAPACGLVSKILNMRDPNSSVIFLPSDHMITENKKFLHILDYADQMIEKYPEHIITIGINPTRPDTGLGYIQMDSQIDNHNDLKTFSVKRFVEKPNLEKAEEYLHSWEYLWNAGMFVWKTRFILELFETNLPETYRALEAIAGAVGSENEAEVIKKEYLKVDKISIDYGIIEKTNNLLVIPGNFGWSDIGSWGTLLQVLSEMHETEVISKGNHIGINDANCLILAGEKLIATVGLSNTVIIDTPDALLVCNSEKSQDVKELLNKFKADGKHLYL